MKQQLGKIFLAVFSLCLIIIIVSAEYVSTRAGEKQNLFFQVGEEVIRAWENEGRYYLFLPAYSKNEEVLLAPYSPKISLMKGKESVLADKRLTVTEGEIQGRFLETGEVFEFSVLQSENLPAIFLETKFGSLADLKADKELEISGNITTIDCRGQRSGKIALQTIKGRGNTSFAGYEKKPYSLTLEREGSLAGLLPGRKYALISNASDPSFIRNDLARRMEITLELPYSRTGQFADLYINGEYEGNYYLCNDIEIGTAQIGIENMEASMDLFYQKNGYEAEEIYETKTLKARKLEVYPADITGGYLLEREYGDRFYLEYEKMGSGFVTEEQEHFVVKSPKYCSVEQIEYLSDYVNQSEKAIMSREGVNADTGKTYGEYIDVESFVKKYLVEEVTKNYDGGVSSSFYYKDSEKNGGRLTAGPGWDYDMSLGNYVEWMEDFSSDPTGISKLSHHTYASVWYEKLYEKEEFYQMVKEDYQRYIEPFLEYMLVEGLEEYWTVLEASSQMNAIRWQKELEANIYFNSREQTFQELKEFIEKRKAYLDEAWSVE